MTNNGLAAMLQAAESKRSELPVKPQPIWLRLENGKVEQHFCDALVAQGRIVYAPKIQDPARTMNRTACLAIPNMFGYNRSGSRPGAHAAVRGYLSFFSPPARSEEIKIWSDSPLHVSSKHPTQGIKLSKILCFGQGCPIMRCE